MIYLSIPFPPSVNRLWRATKGGKVYRSAEYVNWVKATLWEIKIQAKAKRVSGAYKLTILAVKPDKRKRDIGNLEKAVSDVLVHSGVIDDDHLCEWIDARWVPSGPPCRLIIESIETVKLMSTATDMQDRIETLEAALQEIISLGSWGAPLVRTVAMEALEKNDVWTKAESK